MVLQLQAHAAQHKEDDIKSATVEVKAAGLLILSRVLLGVHRAFMLSAVWAHAVTELCTVCPHEVPSEAVPVTVNVKVIAIRSLRM